MADNGWVGCIVCVIVFILPTVPVAIVMNRVWKYVQQINRKEREA